MTLKKMLLVTSVCMMAAVPSAGADNVTFSQVPPGGLKAAQCPMFVLFAFDDNGNSDGLVWFRNLVKDMKNHDNSAARATFLCTGIYGSNDASVLAAWKNLYQDGHEIGNYTWDHPHAKALKQK